MGEPFFARLQRRIEQVESLLCVGLDPHPEMLTNPSAAAARAFCLRLIASTAQHACAFKVNVAFFEVWGADGWAALKQVVEAVPEDIPVILDAKRGDIASTAEAYARAAFETLGADALTVNPYLGGDALAPLMDSAEKGVFLLCKTSNPGSEDLQGQPAADGAPFYMKVAQKAVRWNARGNLGLVVGATDPAALAAVREVAPELWILAPGVGAQGGDLRAALEAGLWEDGSGMIVPVSRAIAGAQDPAQAAGALRESIQEQRGKRVGRAARLDTRFALADALLEAGCIQFGAFVLKSGLTSPIYIDLRRLIGYPRLMRQVARAYAPLLELLQYDRLAALPYAALPIGTAVALALDQPLVYPRKEIKVYGTRAAVEGDFKKGETAVLIDDLATGGESKFEAIARLEGAGLVVRDVVVLIDREGGGKERLARAGYRLHAVFRLGELIDHWERRGSINASQAAAVREFLAGVAPAQSPA